MIIQSLYHNKKTDILGITASTLCLLHCIATPFIFIAHAGHTVHHNAHPLWWGTLDLLFLVVSLLAVYWSARNTSKKLIAYALWFSWIFLTGIIINEKISLLQIADELIYIPSTLLTIFHLYNIKTCKCNKDNCCVSNNTLH